jgi:hypothetical protein
MDLDEVSTTLGKSLSGMLVNETDSIEYDAIAERFPPEESRSCVGRSPCFRRSRPAVSAGRGRSRS